MDPFVLFRVVEPRRDLEFAFQRLDTGISRQQGAPYNSLVSSNIYPSSSYSPESASRARALAASSLPSELSAYLLRFGSKASRRARPMRLGYVRLEASGPKRHQCRRPNLRDLYPSSL